MKTLEKWWFWFGVSFLLYANTLNHAYTIDDLIVVTSNKLTQEGASAIPDIFQHSYLFGYDGREDESYRPLTLTTFALEKSFFDAKPGVSHLMQVLLYGLCIVVLFKFLTNLFGEGKTKLVIAITALFMLHPIHTEVVANVKSRDELLSALFLFLALWLYSKWILQKNFMFILLSLLSFFAATLSKETAVLGVLLFPATAYYMLGANSIETVKKSLVYAIPFLVYFGVRALVLSDVLITDPIDPVANSLALAQSGGEQFTSNLAIFAKYMQLSVFPVQLSWDYSIATFPLVGFGTLSSIIGFLTLNIILGMLVFGLIKRNLIGFGALIFASTFALTSNFFFLINCTLGERFLFMPVLGIIIVIVLLIDQLLKDRPKTISITLLGIFSVFFVGRTITRNSDWKENLSIYESGTAVSPNSVKAHFNLGTEYLEQGNRTSNAADKMNWYSRSLTEFTTAKEIYPKYVNTFENMGFVYAELGKIGASKTESITYYKKGLTELNTAIDSLKLDKPSLFQNKFFILEQLISLSSDEKEKQGLMLQMVQTVDMIRLKSADDYQRQLYYLRLLKQDDELIKVSEKLIKLYPDGKAYLLQLSEEFFKEQQFEKSLRLMTIYVKYTPNDLSAKSNLGMLLEILGKKKEALKIYEEILEVDGNQTHTRDLYEKLKRTI
jgi:tetratricopeptide (TPR) repeat protein